jgi:DNA helicase HerA-like ATPase
VGKLNNNDQSLSMIVALTKWETTSTPAVAVEAIEHQAIAVFWGATIPAIPDLLSLEQARTGMSYETALNQLLQIQQRWVQQLHGDSRFTLSLRIIGSGASETELIFGLMGKTEGNNEAETIAAARNFFNKVRDTLPDGYPLQPCAQIETLDVLRLPFLPSPAGALAEFRRAVSALQTISTEAVPDAVGQQINPWNPHAHHFQDLLRALVCHPTPAAIAINLRPTQLTPQESAYIGSIADQYSNLASISIGDSTQVRIWNTSVNHQEKRLEAEQAAQTWQQLQSNLRSPFELIINLLSESPIPQSIIAALQSAVDGQPKTEQQPRGNGVLVLAQSEAQKIAVRQNWADLSLHRWANLYDLGRLPWLFSPEEVHAIFRLPIADRNGVWGLPSAAGARDARRPQVHSERDAEIQIGALHLSKKQLTQHLLISGVPGSGKTNTSLYLLETLWRSHQIPWMVLEPAKTEYRGLRSVASLQNDLLIFTLGDERVAPFRFNPFELPPSINLDSHMGALLDLFSISMSMWGPLPNVVEQLIYEAYKRKGFTSLGDNQNLQPPRFSDLAALIPEIVPKLGYKKETTDEITAAISIRLNKFRRGALGRMLDTTESMPFDTLMQRPVILEMSQVGNSDDRAFLMGLILNRCYQYWTARRHEATGELKHLLLVEEAHNLLANASESTDQEQANPKGKAVRNFANMLAEVRGFGQGIAIAEQNPNGLVPDVMVNTNIKLAHRVVEATNRAALGRSMLLTPQQETQLASLKTGQLIYYVGGDREPSLTNAPNFKDAENGFNPRLSDAEIHTFFSNTIQPKHPTLYAPPPGCPTEPNLAHCLEQGADVVQALSEHPHYKSLKTDLLLQLLAAPFGAPAADAVRPTLGRILVERGANHLKPEEVQGILNSAMSLLALEAAQEKGKVHGWLGHQVQQAHQILTEAIFNPYAQVQDQWIELCRIPENFLRLSLSHPEYINCSSPGVFRYEVQTLLNKKEHFYQYLSKVSDIPAKALEDWITSSLPFFGRQLPKTLQISLQTCAAIQLTEKRPDFLASFMPITHEEQLNKKYEQRNQ